MSASRVVHSNTIRSQPSGDHKGAGPSIEGNRGNRDADAEKAAANLRNHGVAFEKAIKAFGDPFAIESMIARSASLRGALHLTQEEFATRYRIPIGTLRDWEQRRCEPDQLAQAYLTVIAHDPEGVHRALNAQPV
jgi:DNA-binding transcriptional regulator YiaG